MQPLLSLLSSLVFCNHQGFPADVSILTMTALGEAESGSGTMRSMVGTQPDEE